MNAKDPAHSEDTIREGEESGSPSLFFFLHSRFYLRLCPWMSRDEYTLSNKSLFICGSGQVLRFAWLKIRKANSLPPISFGQYLCHKTFFFLKFSLGLEEFCLVMFLVVATCT